MTETLSISLIVVSRGRPKALLKMLRSLRFQTYLNFEVIVVSKEKPKCDKIGKIRYIEFDKENISEARNIGIANSRGDILAFCDDDAVPEPPWLERLVAPFENKKLGFSGGYVRGRNGITFQWRALETDVNGNDRKLLRAQDSSISIHGFVDGHFVKAQGTNIAFRRLALMQSGIFDEAYRFFLDETDLCLRVSKLGWLGAVVPLAEVQHGFEENDVRSMNRIPKSLSKIGFSKGYFIQKHGNLSNKIGLKQIILEQKIHLTSLMLAGWIEPRNIDYLLKGLALGFYNGAKACLFEVKKIPQKPHRKFEQYNVQKSVKSDVLVGNVFYKKRLMRQASLLAENNIATTVFCFSRSSIFHRRYFDERGFWVQVGGIFGRSSRLDPLWTFFTTKSRAKREQGLLSLQRKFD